MSALPPAAVVAAAVRVAEGRAYTRAHFPNGHPDKFVGYQPADEYDRDIDFVAAWVLKQVVGSEPCPLEPHEQGLVYDAEKDVMTCPLCGHKQWEEMGV